jgi:response regulator NasT
VTRPKTQRPADEPPSPELLVVDDDRLVLATLGRGLRDAGYRVLEADSGEQALALAAEHQPALALIDQQLPGMCGLEIARRLTETASVPFIFVTACAEPLVVEDALRQGALAYLVKPLDLPQVLPMVRTALERAHDLRGLRTQAQQLNDALRKGREVSTAVGLVMGRLSLTQDEALERLRHHARSERMRLEEVARVLIAAQEDTGLVYRRLAIAKPQRDD